MRRTWTRHKKHQDRYDLRTTALHRFWTLGRKGRSLLFSSGDSAGIRSGAQERCSFFGGESGHWTWAAQYQHPVGQTPTAEFQEESLELEPQPKPEEEDVQFAFANCLWSYDFFFWPICLTIFLGPHQLGPGTRPKHFFHHCRTVVQEGPRASERFSRRTTSEEGPWSIRRSNFWAQLEFSEVWDCQVG